jgi:parallel beta-helix repeat protein
MAGALPASAQTAALCTGVKIAPGDSIQAKIDANGQNTTFCLSAGTYRPAKALNPKAGSTFTGESGVVLDGVTGTFNGWTNSSRNVTIQDMTVQNFQVGVKTGTNWTLDNLNLYSNEQEGARLITQGKVLNSHVHHNGLGGIQGFGADILVEGNEVDHNQIYNYRCSSKFVHTTNLVVRNNHLHDNRCPVLWADINSYNPLFEGNTVENNNAPAIDCEISYRCTIRNNIVRNNTKGILVSSTPDAEVYGNIVENNAEFSIRITQQGTDAGIRTDHPSSYGPHVTRDNHVHDNQVTMPSGYTGVTKYGNVGDAVFSAAANNDFEGNVYRAPTDTKFFKFSGGSLVWNQWQSKGHDNPLGSFVVGP